MNLAETILIIDDEVQIRRLLEITLASNGYKISEASTGKEGLIAAATHHPALIILDLGLPDIDGIEVLESIRKWSNVPVIVVSAQPHAADVLWSVGAHTNPCCPVPSI